MTDILKNIARPEVSHFGELKSCNDLLGDREALDQFWEENGYWYFKGVLDLDVINQLKAVWIDYLHREGLIDPDVNENRYNGAPVNEEEDMTRITEFNERNLHTLLTEHPGVNAIMAEILGDEPFWLPIAEYRANPPGDDPGKNRFLYPHQDGFYSRDMPMKICWIPVDDVDLDVGGCAWVEGAHRGPLLHDVSNPPLFPISAEALPNEGWKTANFAPGDIVIFDLNTPHSGLSNISRDRFRMSFDIRVTEASGKVPTIGKLVSLSEHQVTVHNNRTGGDETYAINQETYVRGTVGQKREGADIPTTFAPGELIIVNSRDGSTATLVRATH